MAEFRHSESVAARGTEEASLDARSGRTDAVNSGIVYAADPTGSTARSGGDGTARSTTGKRGKAPAATAARGGAGGNPRAEGGGANNDTTQLAGGARAAAQRTAGLREAAAGAVAEELDDTDELEGNAQLRRDVKSAQAAYRRARRPKQGDKGATASEGDADAAPAVRGKQTAGKPDGAGATASKKGEAAKARMQRRRSWRSSRAAAGKQAAGARQVAAAGARRSASRTVAAAASSAAAPLAGIAAGAIAFALVALMVSQALSALAGFWENEIRNQMVVGLPPYITAEMVETALECQEKYGHPAGCTIAQIICESGGGDRMSRLAEDDNNLFGIKWAASFSGCPETDGFNTWQTREEVGGRTVTIMAKFTRFKSQRDCIVFRSRVLLANSRYAQNPLIKEAIEKHDSDKMAEGLKDAGYATSSDYVESLKSVMKDYNLYRFDGMTLEAYKEAGKSGDAVVAAARSQLGVPYVWGGETPNVALDCSGLTMYCYSTVGISIPHYTEDQKAMARVVPLSEARPGDVLYKPGHVAIYIGGDKYIHAPHTGDVVRVASGISRFTCALQFR